MKVIDVFVGLTIFLFGVSLFVMADKLGSQDDLKSSMYISNVSNLFSSIELLDWCEKNSAKQKNVKPGYNETVFKNKNCKDFKQIDKD